MSVTPRNDAAQWPDAAPRKNSTEYTAWQLRRVLSLITWIQTTPDASLVSATEKFGVPLRQMRAELGQAGESGVPSYLPGDFLEITVDTSGLMHADVKNPQGLHHAPALTDSEANTLILSLERLGSVLPAEAQEDVQSLVGKIRSMQRDRRDRRENFTPDDLTAATGAVGSGGPGNADAIDGTDRPETLGVLREAVSTRRWVALTYTSLSSDTTRRRELIPDQVEFINGSGYLWARDADLDQRCFNISRMTDVEILDRAAPPVVEHAVDDADPFGFDRADQQWAELELEDDAGWMFEYLPMWQVDDGADDPRLRAYMPDTGPWLERFLLAYSPYLAEISDSDEDLARRTASRAAAAVEAYGRLA